MACLCGEDCAQSLERDEYSVNIIVNSFWLLHACGDSGGDMLAWLGRLGRLGVPGISRLPMLPLPVRRLVCIFSRLVSLVVDAGKDTDFIWPATCGTTLLDDI